MRRRDFIIGISGSAIAWPLVARAQQPAITVVAVVSGQSPDADARNAAAFHKGLGEAGIIDGQNVSVEYHWLEGRYERLPALMADLVRRQVAVIAIPGSVPAVLAAKAATARFRSSSASLKTRSGLVLSTVSPDLAPTRQASIFSPMR
jgi:putative ABC transport system substrate-binding protein